MVAHRTRRFWLELIRAAWRSRSVVWLSGVRRAGKTTLARSIEGLSIWIAGAGAIPQ